MAIRLHVSTCENNHENHVMRRYTQSMKREGKQKKKKNVVGFHVVKQREPVVW